MPPNPPSLFIWFIMVVKLRRKRTHAEKPRGTNSRIWNLSNIKLPLDHCETMISYVLYWIWCLSVVFLCYSTQGWKMARGLCSIPTPVTDNKSLTPNPWGVWSSSSPYMNETYYHSFPRTWGETNFRILFVLNRFHCKGNRRREKGEEGHSLGLRKNNDIPKR